MMIQGCALATVSQRTNFAMLDVLDHLTGRLSLQAGPLTLGEALLGTRGSGFSILEGSRKAQKPRFLNP